MSQERLGGFALRHTQRRGVAQIQATINEFGGALLADPPGTGKTIIALAVARSYADVLVVLPATLRGQWMRAASRAGVPVRFATFEALSRSAAPTPAALVIVDEAHHARTPATARHRALARACVGAQVLLLSATPVVNRRKDRDALLALFLGARAASLSAAELSRVVIRRAVESGLLPAVVGQGALAGAADVAGLADALRSLPPALPTVDGTPAMALIRISLALAWCSSLAALDGALRRRLQRGAALRDVLLRGRWPTRDALRGWVMSDDDTQLAFVELLVPEDARLPDASAAVSVVETHLAAVRSMRALVAPHVERDISVRAEAIRAMQRERPHERVVVFARHADTIRALWRELRRDGGVVAITGTRVDAAAGRWRREEVLDAIGPRAGAIRADDPRAVRLLLSTDLLAEGVDMPGVRTVVHADLAWTPARLEQRRGRITRAGSGADEVRELRFALPADAVPFVRLLERLHRKRRAQQTAVRDAVDSDVLEQLLAKWASVQVTERWRGARVAAVSAGHTGFLALVRARAAAPRDAADPLLLAGTLHEARWTVSARPGRVLTAARAASGAGVPLSVELERTARRVISAALRARAGRALAGTGNGEQRGRSGTLLSRLAVRSSEILRRAPFAERPAIALLDARIRHRLAAGVGLATERALGALLAERVTSAEFCTRVGALLSAGVSVHRGEPTGTRDARERHTVVALLLLVTDGTPRSATRHSVPSSASP